WEPARCSRGRGWVAARFRRCRTGCQAMAARRDSSRSVWALPVSRRPGPPAGAGRRRVAWGNTSCRAGSPAFDGHRIACSSRRPEASVTGSATDLFPGTTEFEEARRRVSAHAYHTPLVTSRTLSARTGFEVRLKAEMLQRTGSYKIRGPLNKFPLLTEAQRRRGVICSSAGNHA